MESVLIQTPARLIKSDWRPTCHKQHKFTLTGSTALLVGKQKFSYFLEESLSVISFWRKFGTYGETIWFFMLKCCYKPDCLHPFCSSAGRILHWFPNGPPISYVPLPIPDPDQPWGSTTCSKCEGRCYGHFISSEKAQSSTILPMNEPPSSIIKKSLIVLMGIFLPTHSYRILQDNVYCLLKKYKCG